MVGGTVVMAQLVKAVGIVVIGGDDSSVVEVRVVNSRVTDPDTWEHTDTVAPSDITVEVAPTTHRSSQLQYSMVPAVAISQLVNAFGVVVNDVIVAEIEIEELSEGVEEELEVIDADVEIDKLNDGVDEELEVGADPMPEAVDEGTVDRVVWMDGDDAECEGDVEVGRRHASVPLESRKT